MTVAEVAAIRDPTERAEMAIALIAEANSVAAEALRLRDLAFGILRHEQQQSIRQIATRFGVSKSLVATVTG